MLLKDKVAVIAGNAYGIGDAAAALFSREGASVFCVDDSAGRERASSIRCGDLEIPYFHADVTNTEQVQAAARACAKARGKVNILFNVAGLARQQRFEQTTDELWELMLRRNLTSAFLCSKYFLPLMKEAGPGSIINQGSIDSFLGNPNIAAYSAAKGGLLPLTHVMAHDLAQYGIRVNCISTGGIRSTAAASSAIDEARVAVTPSQRMGTPDDVANVALFLASPLSAYVNGSNLVVDGGRTAITQGCFEV